jgi:hypothetical protein
MNLFNFIPHAVIQWEISSFLLAQERAEFNAVLEPTERVYKKLPLGFAEKHALRAAYSNQASHANHINLCTDNIDDDDSEKTREYARRGIEAIGRYASFFLKPASEPLFKYRAQIYKTRAIKELADFLSAESIYEPFITQEVTAQILLAIDAIQKR